MAFQMHIVRQRDYKNPEEESNISLDEWLQYINSDPELELLTEEGPGFCQWLEHPKAEVPWFDFGFANIYTKNPDKHTLKKMINISIALNGKVRSDDFEYYDETYFTNGGYPIIE
jgi:hypothetical protein